MTMQTSTSSSTHASQTITALFDSRSEAMAAVEELVSAGIPRTSIRVNPETDTVATPGSTYDTTRDDKGFWASLGDLFVPDDDRATYAEAMHRGSIMVAVTVTQAHAETAESILEQHGTVDLDEREASWKSEGWSATAPAAVASTPALGLARSTSTASTTTSTLDAGRSTASAGTAAADDGTLKLYEEKLNIGKRQVSAGRVKIRSYVVETPVTEDVNLHSETVHLDRRPVDREVAVGDAVFQDRTIEATEMAEEAVVSKTARVTEEIGLRKVASDQVKTVSDTVRRTEVDIEDERENGLAKPPLGTPRT